MQPGSHVDGDRVPDRCRSVEHRRDSSPPSPSCCSWAARRTRCSSSGKVLDETRLTVRGLSDEAVPAAARGDHDGDAHQRAAGQVDAITTNVAQVSTNVSALTALFAATLGSPVVKVAAFSYGVRQALNGRRRRPARGRRGQAGLTPCAGCSGSPWAPPRASWSSRKLTKAAQAYTPEGDRPLGCRRHGRRAARDGATSSARAWPSGRRSCGSRSGVDAGHDRPRARRR